MDNIPRVPDDDLYEDLDRSLAQNRARSRKRKSLIVGGVLVGLGMAYYFSYVQPLQETSLLQPAPAPVVKTAPPEIERPAAEQSATDDQAAVADAAVADQAEAEEPAGQTQQTEASTDEVLDPRQVDERLAALNKMNLIKEDMSATNPKPSPPPVRRLDVSSRENPDGATPVESVPVEEPSPAAEVKIPESSPSADPSPVEEPEGALYTVQVIATVDALVALETRDKLAEKGHKPWIATSPAKQRAYRVEVGVFKTIREAASLSARLGSAGFQNRAAYLSGGNMVTLVLGSFQKEVEGERLAKKASAAGFDARVRLRSDTKNMYMVRVGKFKTRQEAQDAMVEVRKAGFHPEGITK
ncbi:MAG: SPOR domain-containing protein [Nitrospinota bacterium]|nr:SPOR domain-containing protein [Nitrospinota bacterium]